MRYEKRNEAIIACIDLGVSALEIAERFGLSRGRVSQIAVAGGRRRMFKPRGFDWNVATIRLLRLLWSEGLPTSEIGRRLGCSKDAVIGKAHRLDLDARRSPIKRQSMESVAA